MGETANTEGNVGDASNGGTPPVPVLGAQPEFKPEFAPEDVQIDAVDFTKPAAIPLNTTPVSHAAPRKELDEVDKGVGTDIAKILGGIKLPERPNATPSAPARKYDTALAADAQTAETVAEKEARIREAARAVQESLPGPAATKVDDVRAYHTLKDDLQDVVRTKKISMVRAVALEEEKRHRPLISPDEEARAMRPPRQIPLSLVVAVFLFLLGAGALGGTYYVLSDRAGTAAPPITSEVLFAEQAVPLPIDGLAAADIRREVANARNSGALTLGAIFQIVPVRSSADPSAEPKTLSFNEFLQAIGARPPEELTRALGDEFFFGIHTVDENAPVFVVPVTSYERAFAGMLAWEPLMNADLAPMFSPVPAQTVGPDGVLVERKFEDTVIRNYDVRVLKDESGTIQLYYSFPTRNILIIAESQYSFTEILSRLRADRKL